MIVTPTGKKILHLKPINVELIDTDNTMIFQKVLGNQGYCRPAVAFIGCMAATGAESEPYVPDFSFESISKTVSFLSAECLFKN